MAKLIELVNAEYSRTGSGMNVRISQFQHIASPPTIRKHFPGGIPEIAAEAVRQLSNAGAYINPHLDALASSALKGEGTDDPDLAIALRLSRIPLDPREWKSRDVAEVEAIPRLLQTKGLADRTKARLHYIAAQYHSPWASIPNTRFEQREQTGGDITSHLESALDLFLRAQDWASALLTFIELRNYRICSVKDDPAIADIRHLYRDCVAMGAATLRPTTRAWIQALEGLYARALGFSDTPIHDTVLNALSCIEAPLVDEHFTYAMQELRGILLLGIQVGEIRGDIRDNLPGDARQALGPTLAIALGGVRAASFAKSELATFALLLQRDWGITPTRYRTREFWRLLQTHLGLTREEAAEAFARHNLSLFDDTRRRELSKEARDAADEFERAARKLMATPRDTSFDFNLKHTLSNLGVLADDLSDVARYREMFIRKDMA